MILVEECKLRLDDPVDDTEPARRPITVRDLLTFRIGLGMWLYNTGSYVLGVLIARASGQPLETFFRERLFKPLGMRDTSFSVPFAKLDRLAVTEIAGDSGESSQWGRPAAFPQPSTDYLAFGQMLLDKGSTGASASCPGLRLRR